MSIISFLVLLSTWFLSLSQVVKVINVWYLCHQVNTGLFQLAFPTSEACVMFHLVSCRCCVLLYFEDLLE